MEQTRLIAKTFQGLEEVLARELEQIGAQDIKPGRRMVEFRGDLALLYKANLRLRTAVRVLKPIHTFKAKDADEVYNAVKSLEWADYLDLQTSFSVDAVVYSEEFRHSKYVSYKVKDAIIDYFRERTGQRPNISVANPDLRLNIHIAETDCTLSLDSSGESLHKRGYRVETVESPISEVLAAGMILLSGWDGQCDLIDPMCGSGTIAIEAALIATNTAPGLFRKNFAFEKWKDFDPDLFHEIYNDDSEERPFAHHIYAYDIDPRAVHAAQANAQSAGMLQHITIEQRPLQQFQTPEQKATIITNPPYGERLQPRDLLGLYRTLGEKLKHKFTGGDAWIIGYKEEAFEQIGLRPSLKIPLYNGALDCELRKYQIFDGKLAGYRAEGGILKTEEEKERNLKKRKLRPRVSNDDGLDDEIPEYIRQRHRDFEAQYGERRTKRASDQRSERSDERGERRDTYNNRSERSDRQGRKQSQGRSAGAQGARSYSRDRKGNNRGGGYSAGRNNGKKNNYGKGK